MIAKTLLAIAAAIIILPAAFVIFSVIVGLDIPAGRNYHDYIKGVWEPWPPMGLPADMALLAEDGINTISLGPMISDDWIEFSYGPALSGLASEAKKNNMSVHIAPQAFGPEGADPSKIGLAEMDDYAERAIRWAELCEKYKIEYFSPMNEPDCVMGPERAVEWHMKVLPEVRKVYSGRVVAKWGCGGCAGNCTGGDENPEVNARVQRVSASAGFDGVMLDMFPPEDPAMLETFYEWLGKVVEKTSLEADRLEMPIYIGEFAVATEKPDNVKAIMPGPVVSAEAQAEFARRCLDIVMPKFDGVIYCGWGMAGYGMKGKPVEAVIKEKFTTPQETAEEPAENITQPEIPAAENFTPLEVPAPEENITPQAVEVSWYFDGSSWAHLGSPPACPPLVFQSPVDTTLVYSVLYPGQLRGGNYKAHGGFRFDGLDNGDITVRAPMDGYVYQGSRYLEGGRVQYLFDIINPCGILHRFDHLYILSDKFAALAANFSEPTDGDSRTTGTPRTPVAAGEIIATSVGLNGNVFVDWGVYNLRQKNSASSDPAWLAQHPGSQEPYALCWLGMLPPEDSSRAAALPGGDYTSGKQSDYCD